jgi:aspartyl-tRNA(Asn)/glutamyl-tRNA(Gln) amidotransferase subunit C
MRHPTAAEWRAGPNAGVCIRLPEVSVDEVRRIAQIAHIMLNDTEVEQIRLSLKRVAQHAVELQQIDTSHVPPTWYVFSTTNIYREDECIPGMPPAKIIHNAPDSVDGFFRVPAFMEDE